MTIKEERLLISIYRNNMRYTKDKEMIAKLVKQGQLKQSKHGQIYLSDEGIIVARGVLM